MISYVYILCIVAMIFLASVISNSVYMGERKNKMYLIAIAFNILSFVGYLGRGFADTHSLVFLNYFVNVLIYCCGCTIVYFFLLCNIKKGSIEYHFATCVELLHVIIALSTPWTKAYFTISSEGVYIRGKIYSLASVFALVLMAMWIRSLLVVYKNVDWKNKIHIVSLGGFEVFAIILQAVDGRFKLEYIGASFLLAIYYAFLIEVDGKFDELTGAGSVRDYYSEIKQYSAKSRYMICLVTADNNEHIMAVGQAAVRAFAGSGKVFRTGNNEFVAISRKIDDAKARKLTANISEELGLRSEELGMTITASTGFAKHFEGEEFAETLHRADMNMRENRLKARKAL